MALGAALKFTKDGRQKGQAGPYLFSNSNAAPFAPDFLTIIWKPPSRYSYS